MLISHKFIFTLLFPFVSFSILFLAGCASAGERMVWMKAGADEAGLMQAEDGCAEMAQNLDRHNRQLNFQGCMNSKGWYLADTTDQKSEIFIK